MEEEGDVGGLRGDAKVMEEKVVGMVDDSGTGNLVVIGGGSRGAGEAGEGEGEGDREVGGVRFLLSSTAFGTKPFGSGVLSSSNAANPPPPTPPLPARCCWEGPLTTRGLGLCT